MNFYISYLAYIYKDGKLTPKNDILPLPKFEDFVNSDELIASPLKAQFEKECKQRTIILTD